MLPNRNIFIRNLSYR